MKDQGMSTGTHRHGQSQRPVILILLFSVLFLAGIGLAALLPSCSRDSKSCPIVAITFDVTKSTEGLRPLFVQLSDQLVGRELDPECPVIGRHFQSNTRASRFFESTARDIDHFHSGVQAILTAGEGKETPGKSVLDAVKEDADLARSRMRPFIAVVFTDGGFDDLKKMTEQARTLAQDTNLSRLFLLPVTDEGEFAQRLKEALAPLGDRVRIATKHDVQAALGEIYTLQAELAQRADKRLRGEPVQEGAAPQEGGAK